MGITNLTLNFDHIKDRFWRFYHESGHVASEFFRFLPDGTVGGYKHKNERYWSIEEGTLCLLNTEGHITVRFDSVDIKSGKTFLKGNHIPNPKIVLCLEEQDGGRLTQNPTRNALAKEVEIFGWSIGNHTYGVPFVFEKSMASLKIGKYCSIASGVKISLGNHRTDTFTTYPFKSFRKYWQNVPDGVEDHSSRGDVVVGSDVWVGTDVFIGSGISIGSGAIIGAKSVIVRDIPPYAIVVGNPGRVVKYRFDSDTVEELLRLSWWDLSDELVDSMLPVLMSNDTPALLSALRRARSSESV